jgi:biopolymer transport protein ExbD
MRRFSQRGSLVTLSEINITPLLDLAFVLLIIFVITTPLLEQGLPMKLPSGGKPDQRIEKTDIRTVEVGAAGIYMLEKRQLKLDDLESALVREHRANSNLVVYLRADEGSRWKDVAAVLDRCQRNGIVRINPRTDPPKRR